ncbi:hypothetical protein CBA19CS11_35690 [Caballeronia novacaledonica]|uniref:hypothetical protein n=1 Tax=Caballeronia novacaledonica TaxID=1544861 RepID=UPI001EE18230|nr:hypothetical protein [Caballeronia novacaledonica]GJH14298.1 hypothetical protein CBA19CS11_35690 [Caballeronia novacaledonica]
MLIERGLLQSIEIEYARERRFAQRRQTSSHRAPRYLVRYRLDDHAQRAIVATAPFARYLIAKLRGSLPGDEIEAWLSDDGASLLDWTNLSVERLVDEAGTTWDDE